MPHSGREVASLTVAAQMQYLPGVADFTRQMGLALGLDPESARALEHAVDEAATNVVQHAYLPGEEGSFTIKFLRRPGQVVAAIEDQGMPFDMEGFRRGENTGLGFIFLKRYADQLNTYNRGSRGKRLEIVKRLGAGWQPAKGEQSAKGSAGGQVDPEEPIEVRLMEQGEAVELARLFYRCHGYSYPFDVVYYPDQLRELLANGLLTSGLAVTWSQEVVGHAALVVPQTSSRVGRVAGLTLEPPRLGRGLKTELLDFVRQSGEQRGLLGLMAEAGPSRDDNAAQLEAQGFRECCLLLGRYPGENSTRLNRMQYYLPLGKAPRRPLYPPEHHREMISRLMARCGLEREIGQPARNQPTGGNSQLDIRVQNRVGRTVIHIRSYGGDCRERVEAELGEMCRRNMACIHLDMPLDDPATAQRCSAMEELGFFFAGILPEQGDKGDLLRLQYVAEPETLGRDAPPRESPARYLWDYTQEQRGES